MCSCYYCPILALRRLGSDCSFVVSQVYSILKLTTIQAGTVLGTEINVSFFFEYMLLSNSGCNLVDVESWYFKVGFTDWTAYVAKLQYCSKQFSTNKC